MKTAQESLVVLQELGEELKNQVEASAAAAIQSDHLALNQNLSALEQALCKQQAVLQVCKSLNLIILWYLKTHKLAKTAWEKRLVPPVQSAFPRLPRKPKLRVESMLKPSTETL